MYYFYYLFDSNLKERKKLVYLFNVKACSTYLMNEKFNCKHSLTSPQRNWKTTSAAGCSWLSEMLQISAFIQLWQKLFGFNTWQIHYTIGLFVYASLFLFCFVFISPNTNIITFIIMFIWMHVQLATALVWP